MKNFWRNPVFELWSKFSSGMEKFWTQGAELDLLDLRRTWRCSEERFDNSHWICNFSTWMLISVAWSSSSLQRNHEDGDRLYDWCHQTSQQNLLLHYWIGTVIHEYVSTKLPANWIVMFSETQRFDTVVIPHDLICIWKGCWKCIMLMLMLTLSYTSHSHGFLCLFDSLAQTC